MYKYIHLKMYLYNVFIHYIDLRVDLLNEMLEALTTEFSETL